MAIPMLGAQLYKAGTFNPIEAFKEIGNPDPTALNNILNAYKTANFADPSGFIDDVQAEQRAEQEALSQAMYGKSLAEITRELGVAPSFKRGKKPGDIDIETGNTFDEDGQAGGAYEVPTYATFADFTKAMSISAKTGFMGSKATAKDVMSRNPVTSKTYQRAQSFLNAFKEDKEDKKPEVKTPTRTDDKKEKKVVVPPFVDDTASSPPSDSAGGVDLAPAGADYEGSRELASQYEDDPSSLSGDPSGGFGGTDMGSSQDTFSGADGDFGFTAKGGLMDKKKIIMKKKPKGKRMKRGGLASR
jgi:hypothetical protein